MVLDPLYYTPSVKKPKLWETTTTWGTAQKHGVYWEMLEEIPQRLLPLGSSAFGWKWWNMFRRWPAATTTSEFDAGIESIPSPARE
jgi:hypothetical protein